ncbi:hypothetical protein B0T25DRAFT_128474 [Lasiosphaeria hispida]|uniref:PLD phosphodiesterase domain-containing protein n=1 Tax=Lasiosphaeria hispida TaxID=260671 RepID=A0AAJ0MII2_9PEZI|nr:hypothetical protein B0T25DRAFT_128474 [Lasiosphaeria hispida]
MSYSSSFVHDFVRRLGEQRSVPTKWQNDEFPDFDFRDASDHNLLVSRSSPRSFRLGTGASIFADALIPAIVSAKSEVIFVTCFWAPSVTLSALHDALSKLAIYRRDTRSDAQSTPLRVRICLSSRSLFQKLFHPQSRHGRIYPPSSWQKDFGLPDPALLEAGGIELQVKSLFFLPFSVMHPKFVIIDRQLAFVPSCNVSWEAWLEGCVELTGDAVHCLMSFYVRTWEAGLDLSKPLQNYTAADPVFEVQNASLTLISSPAHHRVTLDATTAPLQTIILPSSHHWNPVFHPLPWQKYPKVPGTPLNIALLELFDRARQSIYVQTPNVTCEPVIATLLDAIRRGVDVTIVTSRNMMLIEQLVTAGTTTAWCIRSLVRRFNKLEAASEGRDLEADGRSLGRLRVSYFRRRPSAKANNVEGEALIGGQGEEPVHSHLKLTIVDDEFTVLGSGNMDRASWYTSQELGILFHDGGFAGTVKAGVDSVLDGRLDLVFDSQRRQERD